MSSKAVFDYIRNCCHWLRNNNTSSNTRLPFALSRMDNLMNDLSHICRVRVFIKVVLNLDYSNY